MNIDDLELSSRLRNILRRYEFSDLRKIGNYSKETILKMGNMGKGTFEELQDICKEYGVVIHENKELKDRKHGISWTWRQCDDLFRLGIRTLNDIRRVV